MQLFTTIGFKLETVINIYNNMEFEYFVKIALKLDR